jgi:hypothetical protein
MAFLLDCESGESAIETLCNGFSCSKEALIGALSSIDIDDIYEKQADDLNVPAEEYLYNHAVAALGPHKPLASVCWFHLTRTLPNNNFCNGVVPLGQSLDTIWDMMLTIQKDKTVCDRLSEMRSSGVNNWLYDFKSKDSFHWGPYAILVKDVAFCARKLGQHDYLGMPEIVEDICNGYEEQYRESIVETYCEALVPKIVKFKSNIRLDSRCVEAAVSYVYTYIRKQPTARWSVTCFDGGGVAVSSKDILSVVSVQ